MTVVAFVSAPSEARPVVTWAGRLAAAHGGELIIFHASLDNPPVDVSLEESSDGQVQDEIQLAIEAAVADVIRTRGARRGRVPRHAVSVRRVADPDVIAGTISRVRAESPSVLVGASGNDSANSTDSSPAGAAQLIASKSGCDALILYGDPESTGEADQIVVATSDGLHDQRAVQLATRAAKVALRGATITCYESHPGDHATEIGLRQLRSMLRELDIAESPRLTLNAIPTPDRVAAIAGQASVGQLVIVGANLERDVPRMLQENPHSLFGVFRRAPRLFFARNRVAGSWLFPQINPSDYADLYEKLQSGSRWNVDFITMLSLAAGIATLGLIQDSPAVVIGSMLLAPLMTPMIGMGLALNQGNAKLAYACFRAIGRGFCAALLISVFVGAVTPGSDLTAEIVARTEPNILDLLIAFLSGAAGAYALARPSLAGTVAGVAIATALVPPLCSSGISLAYGQTHEFIGALTLLLANILAIILAAAAVFQTMGLRTLATEFVQRAWVKRVVAGLMLSVLAVAVPLATNFMRQARIGKNTPAALAITNELRESILGYVDAMQGVEVLFAGRGAIQRESAPVDFGIILASERPLPQTVKADLRAIVFREMGDPTLRVEVQCVANGWALETSEVATDTSLAGISEVAP